MCWQYLNKFFGSSSRRRSNAANAAASPRPSLANVPQVSLDTLRNAKSAKSVKSAKSAKSSVAAAANHPVPVNVGNQLAYSVSSMDSEMRPSVPAASGGDTNPANPGSASGAGGNAHTEKRNSWWGYLMGKKKSSNESL